MRGLQTLSDLLGNEALPLPDRLASAADVLRHAVESPGVAAVQIEVDGHAYRSGGPPSVEGLSGAVSVDGRTRGAVSLFFEGGPAESDDRSFNERRCFVQLAADMVGRAVGVAEVVSDEKRREAVTIETGTKRIEAELRRADRLISMGAMAAGIAHEIGNPVNLAAMNASVLDDVWAALKPVLDRRLETEGDFDAGGLPYSEMRDEISHLLSGIQKGARRTQRIIRQLKDFAGEDPHRPDEDVVDVNRAVDNAVSLLAHIVKNTTDRLVLNLDPELPRIKGSPQNIEQVLVNLIHNACNAIQDRRQAVEVTTYVRADGETVGVDVRDEGKGIDAETLPRIMELFFTTRRCEGGMGVGLAVSRDIVRAHGGELTVDSRPGKGAEFRVTLAVDPGPKREGAEGTPA